MNALRTLSLLGINLVLVTAACGGDDPIDTDPDPTGSGVGGSAVSTSSGNSTSGGMGGDPSTTTTGSTMVTSTSSGMGGMGSGTGGMGGMEPVDTTPPTIVSVFPTDGASGVADNEVIVVTFSEPMDKPSAQAAFQTTSLGAVTFNWPDDMTMEVTPNGLAYASGGPTVMANVYDYTVTTVATDLAGNPLPANAMRSFSTLRDVTDYMPEVQEISVEANGSTCGTLTVPVGSYAPPNTPAKECRLLVSYDLSPVPAAAQLQSASLSCDYDFLVGDMPSSNSRLEHVSFDPNNLAQGWSASAIQTFANPFGFALLNFTKMPFNVDVLGALSAELAGQPPHSVQFRKTMVPLALLPGNNYLQWRNTNNDPNGGCGAQALQVSYLAP